jgi:radical SAM superfamily enzyme YgiQ (UPF0313 family)
MKLTLIKPKIGHSKDNTFNEKAVMEPLALAIIAALTPPIFDVEIIDDRIEEINYDNPTDLVAITVETFTAKRSYQISSEFMKRGVPVIMGGYHPSHLPEEAILHSNSVFIGDAEEKWGEVIQDLKAGKLKKFYHSSVGNLQKEILPRRDIFNGKNYLPITMMQFSRGCYYRCNFCSVSTFYDHKFFYRKIDDVIKEIEMQDRKRILFVDDNIVMNKRIAKELFKELIPLKIEWFSEADINMAEDKELMDLMAKSGCKGHLIGFESINEQSLIKMDKKPNLIRYDNYKDQIKIIKDYGLMIWAAFTMGHEKDGKDTFNRTLEFAIQHKFALADFNVLMPYPKTPLYDQLKDENRLLFNGNWWLSDDFRFGKSAFIPHNMTTKELEDGCFNARKEYYNIKSIIKRAFDLKANMNSFSNFTFYNMVNHLSYNDALKKQDIILGKI